MSKNKTKHKIKIPKDIWEFHRQRAIENNRLVDEEIIGALRMYEFSQFALNVIEKRLIEAEEKVEKLSLNQRVSDLSEKIRNKVSHEAAE